MGATTGDILNYRRKKGGWSCADVVRVSSFQSAEDVASVEAQRSPAMRDVREYLRALDRLGRIDRVLRAPRG